MPLISVIVPVYKAERCLSKCVASILGQSFPDLELLLIDDGSPDGSGALCDGYAQQDNRVRVIHQENGGVSAARNRGIEEAVGEFISFVDADDWLEPDALELLYERAVGDGCDTAGCAHNNVYPNGAAHPEPGALPYGVYGVADIRTGIVDRLMGFRLEEPDRPVLNGFIWRFLFSNHIIKQWDIRFEGAYLEDELFLVEYFCRNKSLSMTDRPLYNYYINPNSVTHRYLPGYMETFRSFLRRKRGLAEQFELTAHLPGWEDSTIWAGLFIAVANVYAPGNPFTASQQTAKVRAIAADPNVLSAMGNLRPEGLSRNKRVVANLLRKKRYGLLTALYRIKNFGK